MTTDEENGAGFVEGFDETEDLTDDDKVVITDDDGVEIECAYVAVIEHEGAQYVMLQPTAQLAQDDLEEIDTYVFLYEVNPEGLPVFAPIEDDATFEAVCAAFSQV